MSNQNVTIKFIENVMFVTSFFEVFTSKSFSWAFETKFSKFCKKKMFRRLLWLKILIRPIFVRLLGHFLISDYDS